MRNRSIAFAIILVFVLLGSVIPINSNNYRKFQASDDFLPSANSEVWYNDTVNLAFDGDAGPFLYVGDYERTQDKDGSDYTGTGTGAYGYGFVSINFTVPTGINGLEIAMFATGASDDDNATLYVYDWTNNEWDSIATGTTAGLGNEAWINATTYDVTHWSNGKASLLLNSTDSGSSASAYVDYAEITTYFETESFDYLYVSPERPFDTEEVTITAVTDPDDLIQTGTLNAVVYPSSFTDSDYVMTEDPDGVFRYSFDTLPSGHYLFTLRLENSTAIKYSTFFSLTVLAEGLIIWITPFETILTFGVTGALAKDCLYILYIDGVYETSGSVQQGNNTFSLSFEKSGAEGSKHDYSLRIANGSQVYWFESEFYVWENDPDVAERGDVYDPYSSWAFSASFWGNAIIIVIALYIATQGNRRGDFK